MKKKLCLFLAFVLLFSTVPMGVLAAKKKPKLEYNSVILQKDGYYLINVLNYKGKYSCKSNSPSVCEVTKGGLVYGKKVGKAVITVKLKNTGKKLKMKIEVIHKLRTDNITFKELPSENKNSLIFKVINTNDIQVSVDVKINYYKNGKIVKSDTDSISSMRNDDWGIVSFNDVPKYDKYKIFAQEVNWVNCYITGVHIKIEDSQKTDDGVSFKIYNGLKKIPIDDIKVVCFMYDKDGNLYHADFTVITQLKGKQTLKENIRYPIDKNGNYITPDRYELFIVDMYEY